MSTYGADKSKKKKKGGGWFKRLLSPRSPRDEQPQPQGPTLRDYQDVFLACASYLMQSEDFKSTEGVFRVPGTANDVKALTAEIIEHGGKIPHTALTDNVHTVVGAMKGIIKKIGFIDQDLDSVKVLREAVLQDNLDNASELIQAVIEELHATGNKIDRNNADIIDAYIDLCVLASDYEDKTKMNPNNTATVMMMTFDVFMLNLSAIDSLQHQNKLGSALEAKIQNRLTMRQEAEQSISSLEEEVESYAEELSPRGTTQTSITPGREDVRVKQKGQFQEPEQKEDTQLNPPEQDVTTKKTPRGAGTGKG